MTKPRKLSPPAKSPAAKRPSGEVRLIGGHWKRTKLKVADKPGLRPTPDRVRETVFNWLGQDLAGLRCVDAFAGTGALGLEAASRGAAQVLLVEQDAAVVAQLQRVLAQLQALKLPEPVAQRLQVQRGDGIAVLRQQGAVSCDVIFLDPPFDAGLYDDAIAAAVRALAPGGTIYLESPTAWTDEALAGHGLVVHRHLKAGAVHAHILHRATPAAGEGAA
jgi:16S rRNA (guanine(966)-N(2))-methyltransferase RsmD